MSKNSEVNGTAFAIAIVCAVGFMIMAAIFALAAFAALVLTVLCIIGWKDGITIGDLTIEPHEARAFIGRGVIGAIIVPVFALFAGALFGTGVNAEAWPYIFVGGYTAGSVGVEYLMAEERKKTEAAAAQYLPPLPVVSPPPAAAPTKHPCGQANCPLLAATKDYARAAPEERAFQFASWDDEEVRR